MPYVDAVEKYVKEKRIPFHMPGHKQGKGVHPKLKDLWGKNIFLYDLTEVDGLDYLNSPNGVIKQAEKLATKAFHTKHTFFLINGSTVGNQAAILLSANKDKEIIIPRNSHESTFSGLILSGAKPIYVNPTQHKPSKTYPVVGVKAIKYALARNPNVAAVHITSPTHSGFLSNVKQISKLTNKKNIPFIVDEAHGSHFIFHPELPKSAILNKADIVIQSSHKTIGSLTQTSMLHLINDKKIYVDKVQSVLRLLQSFSPNTLFVMSLDAARQQMEVDGKEMLTKTLELARFAREQINLIPGFFCYGKEVINTDDIYDIDETKLLINVSETGYSGVELEKILGREYKIEIEMSDQNNILCFITIGDTKHSIDKLLKALRSIPLKRPVINLNSEVDELSEIPEIVLTPRDAFFAEKKYISLEKSVGNVAGEFIIPFPPDIPLLVPGERITKTTVSYIKMLKKHNITIIGPKDVKLDIIGIIKNEQT